MTDYSFDTTVQGNYGSQQQWVIDVSINDTLIAEHFDTFSGGDVSSAPNKHRPGGMGPEITYFALPTYGDISVQRVYEHQRDHALVGQLHKVVGRAKATVTMTPLDADGKIWSSGATRTYTGRLTGVKDGGTDSNSNSPRMLELDITVTSVADDTSPSALANTREAGL